MLLLSILPHWFIWYCFCFTSFNSGECLSCKSSVMAVLAGERKMLSNLQRSANLPLSNCVLCSSRIINRNHRTRMFHRTGESLIERRMQEKKKFLSWESHESLSLWIRGIVALTPSTLWRKLLLLPCTWNITSCVITVLLSVDFNHIFQEEEEDREHELCGIILLFPKCMTPPHSIRGLQYVFGGIIICCCSSSSVLEKRRISPVRIVFVFRPLCRCSWSWLSVSGSFGRFPKELFGIY